MVNFDSEQPEGSGMPLDFFVGSAEKRFPIRGVGRTEDRMAMSVDPGFTGQERGTKARETAVRIPSGMFPVKSALQSAVALHGPSVGVVVGVGSTGSQWHLPVHAGR